MALPVLDGNQSATTLSSVVTGGEHIVAHSVVSLGATAISNINSAVSGSAVTIPGLARLGNSIASDNTADANLDFVKIGGHQDGQNQVAHIVHVSAGGAMKVDASGSSVTFSQAPVTFGAITGSASILNFPSTQTIVGTVTANLSNTVTATWRGAIGSFNAVPIVFAQEGQAGGSAISYDGSNTSLNVNVKGSLPAISGTVTANLDASSFVASIIENNANGEQIAVQMGNTNGAINSSNPLDVSGTVTANSTAQKYFSISAVTANRSIIGYSSSGGNQFTEWDGSVDAEIVINGSSWSNANPAPVSVANSVTIGSLPAISGTVTAAAPNGSLTTRFGTPTTANTAFATSAVTNANRKYLLIQNVTTGSNVITVGIGFTPTTTQGIQLTAGAGITFESSYIPTGAVQILSSVTASNFTILEA